MSIYCICISKQIGTHTNWLAIAAGYRHTLALKSYKTLWAWGRNQSSQLGDGTTVNKHSPVQIGTDKDWVSIAAGNSHSIALKPNCTLWAWGPNNNGQLAEGMTVNKIPRFELISNSYSEFCHHLTLLD